MKKTLLVAAFIFIGGPAFPWAALVSVINWPTVKRWLAGLFVALILAGAMAMAAPIRPQFPISRPGICPSWLPDFICLVF